MVKTAIYNGQPDDQVPIFKSIVSDNVYTFHTSFSSGPPYNFQSLVVDLLPESKPVRFRLRNYALQQR